MKRIIATVVATGLLLAGGASAASGETLYRNGAKKVTITPVSAPAGTQVIKARITVKKGKKTVAKNKAFYKAKKGKYKVTTKLTYRTVTVTKVPTKVQTKVNQTVQTVASEIDAACTVTSAAVLADRTTWAVPGDKLKGEADIRYTGNCTDVLNNGLTVNWVSTWDQTAQICETWGGPTVEPRNTAILRCTEVAQPGAVKAVYGSALSVLPTYQVEVNGPVVDGPLVDGPVVYGPVVYSKSTRTVRVR